MKPPRLTPGTFAHVIRQYLCSPKFEGLEASTRDQYARYLRIAEHPDSLGSVPVAEMRPALVQAFLDGLADKPAAQAAARTAIRSMAKWASVRDLLPHDITFGTEVVHHEGGHVPWTDEHVALAEVGARPELSRVITMAANTGQRGSDLVRMRWTDIEEHEGRAGINVTQQKTGLKLWVPMTSVLKVAIDTWERRPGFILLMKNGHPWTRPQLSNAWVEERERNPALAPIRDAGLVLHGLRGTAVVRLRRAGATIPQISDMVGMSPPMVTRYCRYSVQRENALAAVYTLDRTAIERARDKKRGGE